MNTSFREAAILFADIAGSTALRNRLGDGPAGEQIAALLAALQTIVASRSGVVVKSDGDDVLAVFERDPVIDAATAAVLCQREAKERGLSLYVGLHCGVVEFRESFGRPDVFGQTVNLAARLHKLVADAPGNIFLAVELLPRLSEDLRALGEQYGVRAIKGIGDVEVWTLHWQESDTAIATRFGGSSSDRPKQAPALRLWQNGAEQGFSSTGSPVLIGRSRDCALRIEDPEHRISSRHLRLECRAGRWYARDHSRNGTWLHADRDGSEHHLLNSEQPLPPAGSLALGRRSVEDGDGHFQIRFELASG